MKLCFCFSGVKLRVIFLCLKSQPPSEATGDHKSLLTCIMPGPAVPPQSLKCAVVWYYTPIGLQRWYLPRRIYVRLLQKGRLYLTDGSLGLASNELSQVFVAPNNCILAIVHCSVAQSCPTLCGHMDCSTPGLPVHHQFPEFTQTPICDTIISVMLSIHLILYRPLLLPSVFPSITVFSNELVLHIRWTEYLSFSISFS